jgi:hypothetical protein
MDQGKSLREKSPDVLEVAAGTFRKFFGKKVFFMGNNKEAIQAEKKKKKYPQRCRIA